MYPEDSEYFTEGFLSCKMESDSIERGRRFEKFKGLASNNYRGPLADGNVSEHRYSYSGTISLDIPTQALSHQIFHHGEYPLHPGRINPDKLVH
jgi:hypothetical protein